VTQEFAKPKRTLSESIYSNMPIRELEAVNNSLKVESSHQPDTGFGSKLCYQCLDYF